MSLALLLATTAWGSSSQCTEAIAALNAAVRNLPSARASQEQLRDATSRQRKADQACEGQVLEDSTLEALSLAAQKIESAKRSSTRAAPGSDASASGLERAGEHVADEGAKLWAYQKHQRDERVHGSRTSVEATADAAATLAASRAQPPKPVVAPTLNVAAPTPKTMEECLKTTPHKGAVLASRPGTKEFVDATLRVRSDLDRCDPTLCPRMADSDKGLYYLWCEPRDR